MENITADEFIRSLYKELPRESEDITELMVGFAKLHVEAALKAASDSAIVDIYLASKKSTLSAYPLTNIK